MNATIKVIFILFGDFFSFSLQSVFTTYLFSECQSDNMHNAHKNLTIV